MYMFIYMYMYMNEIQVWSCSSTAILIQASKQEEKPVEKKTEGRIKKKQ